MNIRRSPKKRKAILKAAMTQFAAREFAGTNMDELASLAGVSKRTIYNHFPSKEVLFDAVLEEVYSNYAVVSAPKFDKTKNVREQLEHLLLLRLGYLNQVAFVGAMRIGLVEMLKKSKHTDTMLQKVLAQKDSIQTWLESAVSAKALVISDIDFAGRALNGILDNLSMWPQVVLHEAPLTMERQRKIAAQTAELFLALYKVTQRRRG